MSFSICCTYIVYSRTQRESKSKTQKKLSTSDKENTPPALSQSNAYFRMNSTVKIYMSGVTSLLLPEKT